MTERPDDQHVDLDAAVNWAQALPRQDSFKVSDLAEPGSDPASEASVRANIEAVLLVIDEPVAALTLAQVLECPTEEVERTLRELSDEYDAAERGFQLRQIGAGWRLYTRAACAPVVERFVMDAQQARLTHAALETLAVIAYRQPVSRARVSAIRGVNSDGVIRTLVTRGLIVETGHDEHTQATLFGTTEYFLERLGLASTSDLPDLAPYLPTVDEIASEAADVR